jgi:hypothetical protein
MLATLTLTTSRNRMRGKIAGEASSDLKRVSGGSQTRRNDVQGMISSKRNIIDSKMKLVDGLPGSEGLFAATGIEKKLRLRLSLSQPSRLIALSYNTPECRFNIGDKTIKRAKEKITIGKIGEDVVRDDERQMMTRMRT